MTRNEMMRLRRQMQRRIQAVLAERRSAANQRADVSGEKEARATNA